MVVLKFLDITNLIKAQILYIHKLIEIVIVYKNKNHLFITF